MIDSLQCGCEWERTAEYGDVLRQCAEHEAGAPYAGSEPLTAAEFAELIGVFQSAGYVVVTGAEAVSTAIAVNEARLETAMECADAVRARGKSEENDG